MTGSLSEYMSCKLILLLLYSISPIMCESFIIAVKLNVLLCRLCMCIIIIVNNLGIYIASSSVQITLLYSKHDYFCVTG